MAILDMPLGLAIILMSLINPGNPMPAMQSIDQQLRHFSAARVTQRRDGAGRHLPQCHYWLSTGQLVRCALSVLYANAAMDYDEFVEPVDDEFLCVICHCFAAKPHICREGHTFCLACIEAWLQQSTSCRQQTPEARQTARMPVDGTSLEPRSARARMHLPLGGVQVA